MAAVFFLPAACLSILPGALAADDAKPASGDAFVTAGRSDPRTLVPILASDTVSAEIAGLVFNGLVKYDQNLEITGDLAESWDIVDEGLGIVFHLRKNVKWQDGVPFTAKDVEFTYRRLIDPAVPTPYSGDFKKVTDFRIIDPYTFKVSYSEPFVPALASWGMSVMPAHLLEGKNLMTDPFGRAPVGTGPYVFREWDAQEKIELTENPDYFEHAPYIGRFIYRVMPDADTMFLELMTGEIDNMALSPLQYTRLTDTPRFQRQYKKFKYPSFTYTYMGYNLSDPLFSDARVRKAIDYAVDKQEIIEGVFLGQGRPLTGPILPDSWAYDKNIKPREYDRQKAEALLKETGWADTDKDGWLDRNGRTFEFTLLTNLGNNMRIDTAQIVQRRLKDVGIKMNIRVLEWAVFINEFINKKRFEAVLLGWSLTPDPDCYDIWHSSKTAPGEFNFLGYSNREADRLMEEGRRTFDRAERARIYHRLHRVIFDD